MQTYPDDPEGIRSAATQAASVLAVQHATKKHIRDEIETLFGYSLFRTIDTIRPTRGVPQSHGNP